MRVSRCPKNLLRLLFSLNFLRLFIKILQKYPLSLEATSRGHFLLCGLFLPREVVSKTSPQMMLRQAESREEKKGQALNGNIDSRTFQAKLGVNSGAATRKSRDLRCGD